uniref:Uncharacterized protein n=1 Tax=Solanum lycopersicum TaxID=4081 RepID=A0A3Q7IV97_SOLLC
TYCLLVSAPISKALLLYGEVGAGEIALSPLFSGGSLQYSPGVIELRNIYCTRTHLLFQDCPEYRHSWLLLVPTLPIQVTLECKLVIEHDEDASLDAIVDMLNASNLNL